jgi:hypothetical protein
MPLSGECRGDSFWGRGFPLELGGEMRAGRKIPETGAMTGGIRCLPMDGIAAAGAEEIIAA